MQTVESLIENATQNGDCLLCWLTPSKIYAFIKNYGPAHRFIWEKTNGPIPKGMFICHTCDTPRCINIGHLFLGTPLDNMQDKVRKGRQSFGGPGKVIGIEHYASIVNLRYEGKTYEEIGNKFMVHGITIRRFLGANPHD